MHQSHVGGFNIRPLVKSLDLCNLTVNYRLHCSPRYITFQITSTRHHISSFVDTFRYHRLRVIKSTKCTLTSKSWTKCFSPRFISITRAVYNFCLKLLFFLPTIKTADWRRKTCKLCIFSSHVLPCHFLHSICFFHICSVDLGRHSHIFI
jgi:hypothetical protein